MRGLRILMYHALAEPGETATRFVLPLHAFEWQMRMLVGLRFRVVCLEEAVRTLLAGGRLPPRSIALTFDDGTRDTCLLARPVLGRHGFPATAFVVTDKMGSAVDWTDETGLAGRPTMSWDEALGLEPLFTLQPHTRTHPSLRELPDAALIDEIEGSRRDTQERTAREPTVFAYPYGHYDERVASAVANAGFTAACSVKTGINDEMTPRYELRRCEVHGDRPLRRFLALLLGRS